MGIGIIDNFDVNAKKPIDSRFGPYESPTEALNAIDIVTQRFQGLVVLVTGSAYLTDGRPTEYWFQDGIENNDLVIKPGGSDSNAFPFTGSAEITGSLILTGSLSTTGSVNLTLDTSSTAVDKVMMYDDTTGQVFITSSDAIGGSSVTFVGTQSSQMESSPPIASGTIQKIKTLEFNQSDTETLVQFDENNGELTFIFGDIPTPTVVIDEDNYNDNLFNLEEQTFNIKGGYNIQADGFISASLIRLFPLPVETLVHTNVASSSPFQLFKQLENVTGSITSPNYRFRMELTSSNVLSGDERNASINLELNLDKLPPSSPTNTFDTSQISQFGGVSQIYSNNYIEEGATGSISYTASKGGNDQNFRFIKLQDISFNNPVTMAPSANGFTQISGSIDITTEPNNHIFQFKSNAVYDSNNGPNPLTGGPTPNLPGLPLNDPVVPKNMPSLLEEYKRIKSPRIAGFLISETSSIITNPEDIEFWANHAQISTKPGEEGQLFYQSHSPTAGNPNNLVGYVQNVNNSIHVIVISNSYTLADVVAGGIAGFLGAFDLYPNVNGYNVYVGNAVQGPTGNLAQKYKLITT